MGSESAQPAAAGFWLRLIADGGDAALLALLGRGLASAFKDFLFPLGENGVWIGLALAFLYAGLLQSRWGPGWTLAKRLLRLKVTALDGRPLGLARSFLRFAPLAFVFYSGKIHAALTPLFPELNDPVYQAVYVWAFYLTAAALALPMQLHPLRRGLQDYLAGSLVVRTDGAPARPSPRSPRHALIALGLVELFLTALFATALIRQRPQWALRREWMGLAGRIERETDFRNVSVFRVRTTRRSLDGKPQSREVLEVYAFLDKADFDQESRLDREIRKAADIAAKSSSRPSESAFINVQVRSGFDLGIASFYRRGNHLFDPAGNPVDFEKQFPSERWS